MRDPELVARAGYAAARLEQAWERWRALHGLVGSSDPLASYVGYSLKEPMGQPRVVIGVDAAEAEYFADFLESHECAGVAQAEPRPVNGVAHLPVNGSAPAPRDIPSEPMVRVPDSTDPGALAGTPSAERVVMTGAATIAGPRHPRLSAGPGGSGTSAGPVRSHCRRARGMGVGGIAGTGVGAAGHLGGGRIGPLPGPWTGRAARVSGGLQPLRGFSASPQLGVRYGGHAGQ